MPAKTDKMPIDDPFLKRSSKLLPCQKEMVLWWRQRGLSQRQLAAMFNVSRRLITFILDPEKHAENKQRRAERGGSAIYYNREKHVAAVREHRHYKKKLFHGTN